MQPAPLLDIRNLRVTFNTQQGTIRPVDRLNLQIHRGQTLGVVGESGCGKSVTALSIMRLIEQGTGRLLEGEIRFNDQDLMTLNDAQMQKLRGDRISMIFQEPMTSLNPVFTVGEQIAEVFRIHQGLSQRLAMDKAIQMLELVGIAAPAKRAHAYPHELSGGMRQRVMIAMALALKPDLLIADEPTTALDVTIQAQILELMKTLQHEMGMSLLLITHDLGVVAETCDDVCVMYAGVIVESGPVESIFVAPRHPYTEGLIGSIPGRTRASRLKTISGLVPNLASLPAGCRFQDRCHRVVDSCKVEEPQLLEDKRGHWVRCFNPC